MSMALEAAARGLYTAHPNPRVGCVLARDGQVLASGWHAVTGGPHAEIEALRAAGAAARGATAYVTLEPCSHHGRTPPCADALIEAGVARVVMAMRDPNVRVDGSGRSRLEAAGVAVECGLMQAVAEELNAGFLMRMRAGRPWLRVKTAISLDGRTALRNGASQWISCAESRADVQAWRARSSGILTGIGTVLADDPQLTARVQEPPLTPLRVVVDTHWRTPPGSRILGQPASSLVAGGEGTAVPATLAATGVRCLPLPLHRGQVDLRALMRELARLEVNELQVEAGPVLCGALLRAGLVDELLVYLAPVLLGEEAPGPFALGVLESMQQRTQLEIMDSRRIGADVRLRLRPRPAQRGNDGAEE
jgi:diaminohydroxyphosphoribosylaminopyrimidine deaminase/5-amino-6-(5-phosphoribosylamino)uracil reductase